MKQFFLSFLLAGIVCFAYAQQEHFIYIQADNKQAFYVKIADKVYSSSAAGYAIIPKLNNAVYTLTIGLPKNEKPPQNLQVAVNEDLGFLLKDLPGKGLSLYNLQSMKVVSAGDVANQSSGLASTTRAADNENNFGAVLSNVSNTPDLAITQPVAKPVAEKPAVVQEESPTLPVQQNALPVITPAQQNGTVSRISSFTEENGVALTYLDKTDAQENTVTIFIPVKKSAGVAGNRPVEIVPDDQSAKSKPVNAKPVQSRENATPPTGNEKFLDIEINNPNNADVSGNVGTISASAPKPYNANEKKEISYNSDCKSLADNDDFLKIRKKMVAENNNDDMVYAAKKYFKTKCFTTEQIRNLSVLFLTDKSKYSFFDAAYPFTSDTQNFARLSSELKDEYYIERFNVMIRR